MEENQKGDEAVSHVGDASKHSNVGNNGNATSFGLTDC